MTPISVKWQDSEKSAVTIKLEDGRSVSCAAAVPMMQRYKIITEVQVEGEDADFTDAQGRKGNWEAKMKPEDPA